MNRLRSRCASDYHCRHKEEGEGGRDGASHETTIGCDHSLKLAMPRPDERATLQTVKHWFNLSCGCAQAILRQ